MKPDLEREADQLLKAVVDGDFVVAGALGAEPRYLMGAFTRRAAELSRLDLAAGMFLGGYDFLNAPSVRFRTWFPPGTVGGRAFSPDRIEYLPMGWAQVVEYLTDRARIDVLLLQVSPADADGFHSFGSSASYLAPAAKVARHVIAEINHSMPTTYGERIHSSELAGAIEVDYPLPAFPRRAPAAIDEQIARNVTALVEDDSTLQFGVGSIPDAVLGRLAAEGRRGMRLHAAIPMSILDFVASGGLVEEKGAITIGEALGDQALYDFIDRNERVRMVGGDVTHAVAALVTVPRLTSINSALSVDVYGQVNTEYVDGRHVGAVGGAIDFSRAATWPGNRGIVALRSTTSAGVSRIVPDLGAATVSLPRDSTQFVVTEHGVADLRDKTIKERRREIAKVAHPSFRSSLEEA